MTARRSVPSPCSSVVPSEAKVTACPPPAYVRTTSQSPLVALHTASRRACPGKVTTRLWVSAPVSTISPCRVTCALVTSKVVDAAILWQIRVVTGIVPVDCDRQRIGGMVQVNIADVLPMFRRVGRSEKTATLRRIAPYEGGDWLYITDPLEGIVICSDDLLVPGQDVQRYEDERDLLRRSAHSAGATPRYDWDAMYAWLFKRINDEGLPASQAALVGEVQDWFIRNSKSGKVPEDSTIRKRIVLIWRILLGEK